MDTNIWSKIFLFIMSSIGVLFIGYIAFVFTALMGLITFYTPFVVVVTFGALFFICNGIFKFMGPKVRKITFISFISLCLVAVIAYESVEAYRNSFETLDDQEVDLYEYTPFGKNSKVVSLNEPASFKMEEDLPVLDGATALYPVYSAFARATYPEKEYDVYGSEVMGNTTPDAYENLIEGRADIIFVAGPSERQLQYAEQKGVELKLIPIGREAFVFFVNTKNPVEGLTTRQVQDIYSGEIKNWEEVGGNDVEIRAFQRPPDSGSQTTLEKLMGDIPLMEAPTENVASGMGGIIEEVSNYRNYKSAIGYTFRYYSMGMVQNNAIRHLKIDGVFPDKDTIRNGEYPLAAEFYAVTAGSDNPNIEPFLNWILSEQGQNLIEKTGYVPIGK